MEARAWERINLGTILPSSPNMVIMWIIQLKKPREYIVCTLRFKIIGDKQIEKLINGGWVAD